MSLITNIAQIRSASSISLSNTIDIWRPYISEAEETFLVPVLGEDFFEELDEAANSSASGSSIYDGLLVKARMAVALYALYLGADEMAMSVSGAGVQVVQSETHKPAAEYQVLNLKESWLMRAHRHVDLLLKYLDENRSTFTGYAPVSNDCIITTAAEFQKYVDINSSRRVFLQLVPVMKNVEKKWIRPAITETIYNELLDVIHGSGSSDPSSDQQALLDLVKPAIAHLTIVRALQEITLDLLNWGAFVFSWSTFKSMKRIDEANADRVAMMIQANQRDADAEMKVIQEFLDNNASDARYTAFFESDLYVGPDEAERRIDFVNSAEKAIFVP
jgi:hypothetical protein